jgi:hypothetical protein
MRSPPSPLSSRADDLACGEVMKSMNKTRPKSAVDSIWFNILYIGSEAEGSAVPRTNPGNAEYDCHRILISSSEPSFGLCGASTPTPDSLVIRTRADEMAACLSIVFRVARIGPRNCRSLGSARDDKKERATVHRARLLNRGILQIQFGQLALILFHALT